MKIIIFLYLVIGPIIALAQNSPTLPQRTISVPGKNFGTSTTSSPDGSTVITIICSPVFNQECFSQTINQIFSTPPTGILNSGDLLNITVNGTRYNGSFFSQYIKEGFNENQIETNTYSIKYFPYD